MRISTFETQISEEKGKKHFHQWNCTSRMLLSSFSNHTFINVKYVFIYKETQVKNNYCNVAHKMCNVGQYGAWNYPV